MDEPETIEPEYLDIKKEYEIKIEDNKIRIEMNNDEIIFNLYIDLSYYKYIKEYKYEEIKKELDIKDDIEKIYEYLVNSEYKIIEEEQKIIINGNKEIKLEEKVLTDNEMIKVLIEEIEKINKSNKEKDNKIEILENECKELKEKINCIEQKIYNEINLKYETKEEGECNIFGDKFVELNINNID